MAGSQDAAGGRLGCWATIANLCANCKGTQDVSERCVHQPGSLPGVHYQPCGGVGRVRGQPKPINGASAFLLCPWCHFSGLASRNPEASMLVPSLQQENYKSPPLR